jgi:hypothetical protein
LTKNHAQKFEVRDIYPNPVKDGNANLEVNVSSSQNAQIVILDSTGKELFRSRATLKSGNNLLKLDLRDAPNGVYFVKVELSDGNGQSKRLVIAK